MNGFTLLHTERKKSQNKRIERKRQNKIRKESKVN